MGFNNTTKYNANKKTFHSLIFTHQIVDPIGRCLSIGGQRCMFMLGAARGSTKYSKGNPMNLSTGGGMYTSASKYVHN